MCFKFILSQINKEKVQPSLLLATGVYVHETLYILGNIPIY